MKSLKTIFLTLVLSIGFMLPSCEKEAIILTSCGDVDFDAIRFFDINGLTAFWYKADSIRSYMPINPTDSVTFSELGGLFIQYEAAYHGAIMPDLNPSFSLMTTALACTYIPGSEGSKTEKLTNLSIITLNDFDEDHLANNALNDIMNFKGDYLEMDDLPLIDYLANQTENIKSQYLLLQLNKAPTLNPEVKIQIKVELSTGEIYETEIEPILIME